MQRCDKCDSPATSSARDIRECEPFEDKDGKKWRSWEGASAWRYGCDDHPPDNSKTFYLDETSMWDIEQMELGRAWALALANASRLASKLRAKTGVENG
jgi:hypothetical protein